jgi:hypothetical protein
LAAADACLPDWDFSTLGDSTFLALGGARAAGILGGVGLEDYSTNAYMYGQNAADMQQSMSVLDKQRQGAELLCISCPPACLGGQLQSWRWLGGRMAGYWPFVLEESCLGQPRKEPLETQLQQLLGHWR